MNTSSFIINCATGAVVPDENISPAIFDMLTTPCVVVRCAKNGDMFVPIDTEVLYLGYALFSLTRVTVPSPPDRIDWDYSKG